MDITPYKHPHPAMKDGYWQRWNDDVQRRIDQDITANRQAEAEITLDDCPPGTEVQVEQIDHAFVFGAHLFNFNQLGSDADNERHQAIYGSIFNAATVPFYWKTFELEEGKPRFATEFRDSAAFWNAVQNPTQQAHWRRPATDQIVAFCEERGLRMHGHVLAWGNYKWHYPAWLADKLPAPLRVKDHAFVDDLPIAKALDSFSDEEAAALLADYNREMNVAQYRRIAEIAMHYGDRIPSYDVVNESATDHDLGRLKPEQPICRSHYGPMPGDYAYRALKAADALFPKSVALNINDYRLSQGYVDQIADLRQRGCKIDIMGAQMHLFDPQLCLDIADGTSERQSPEQVWQDMDRLQQCDLPIHLSEITITSPNSDQRGHDIQAIIARNLYRLWFSIPKMMGITWWNAVDDCGAPGEPCVSGLFTRDMQAKPALHVLDDLINNEWKTRCTVTADRSGTVGFRGFRGGYRLRWHAADGSERSQDCTVA